MPARRIAAETYNHCQGSGVRSNMEQMKEESWSPFNGSAAVLANPYNSDDERRRAARRAARHPEAVTILAMLGLTKEEATAA